jgi:P4 family phage/plasmid primase-like protien
MIFDIGLLKSLLGNDTITARKLYENEVQFRPIFKLFINTNYLPHINDGTIFSSNRINVITFDQHFYAPDENCEPKQNHNLKTELKEELSGILNWCLKGLEMYKKDKHLNPPQCVKDATKEYEEQSDKLKNFLKDCADDKVLLVDKTKNASAGKVYELYRDWCEKSGFGTENKSNFFAELKVKGLYAIGGTVGPKYIRNVVVGYELAPLDESFFVDDKELLREQAKK